ncbi:MAG: glycosyltransferase [Burkholderiales bacterium]|nr:glycosyltransferase [Burkholderiales bacterium]
MLSRLLAGWAGRRRRGPRVPVGEGVEALLAEGVALHRSDRLADAERCYLQVLTKDPQNADALNLLGAIAQARLEYDSALDYFQAALGLSPAQPLFVQNLGLALGDLGRLDEALAALRRAHALDPGNERIEANLLFLLRVHPAVEEAECFRAHRAWAARHDQPSARLPPVVGRCTQPERRLRLAYVSGDLRAHAVAAFLEPLFERRDRSAFELFCYRTLNKQDAETERFRALADHWHDVFDLSDEAFANLVRGHEIDILVDLAGITRGHRASALALKPAPVQIGYLGYLGSTGMPAMDYRITDALADPPGHSERFHTERLLRLPRAQWAFAPHPEMPEPSLESGVAGIAFGSFHRLAKLHAAQLALWAELLEQVPGSRLEVVDVPGDEVRERVLAPFRERGIAPERVGTHGRLERDRYWELMRRTDIALDAYPYNGGASTCEALWMGVPVVTRVGRHGFSRSGASILGVLGLEDLVASSDADYLEIAAALAADSPRRAALCATLRDRMRASPLLDVRGLARELEQAYRQAWREYCASHP